MMNKETTVHASVLMPREMHEEAKVLCERLGLKLSAYLVQLVRLDLARAKSAVAVKRKAA